MGKLRMTRNEYHEYLQKCVSRAYDPNDSYTFADYGKEEVEILEGYLKEQGEFRLNQIAEFKKKKQSQEPSILKQMSESAFYGLSYEDCLPKKQKKEKSKRKVFNNVFGKIPIKRH